MCRLRIAAISLLILLCAPATDPHACGWQPIHRASLMIDLLTRVGLPATKSLGAISPPLQVSANERGVSQSTQDSFSLEPGKSIVRELSGGQSHSYKITIISGQYAQIVVKQQGIDVAVVLFTPDGQKISE